MSDWEIKFCPKYVFLMGVISLIPKCVSSCMEVLRGPEGTISSPGYPLPYHDNASCTYVIYVGFNKLVNLTLLEFNVGSANNNMSCVGDRVEISGRGIHCGSITESESILSNDNAMIIHLSVTEGKNRTQNYTGFMAIYKETSTDYLENGYLDKLMREGVINTIPGKTKVIYKLNMATTVVLEIIIGVLVFIVIVLSSLLVRQRSTKFRRKHSKYFDFFGTSSGIGNPQNAGEEKKGTLKSDTKLHKIKKYKLGKISKTKNKGKGLKLSIKNAHRARKLDNIKENDDETIVDSHSSVEAQIKEGQESSPSAIIDIGALGLIHQTNESTDTNMQSDSKQTQVNSENKSHVNEEEPKESNASIKAVTHINAISVSYGNMKDPEEANKQFKDDTNVNTNLDTQMLGSKWSNKQSSCSNSFGKDVNANATELDNDRLRPSIIGEQALSQPPTASTEMGVSCAV